MCTGSQLVNMTYQTFPQNHRQGGGGGSAGDAENGADGVGVNPKCSILSFDSVELVFGQFFF